MKTTQLHLTLQESGLMCNLMHMAMQSNGKKFEDQAEEVKMLSTKLARAHLKLEEAHKKAPQPEAKPKTVFDR